MSNLEGKELLFLGGNHADVPLIKAAKNLGLKVTSLGNRPKDLGHTYSDSFVDIDFSCKETVLKYFEENGFDFVCSGCNDFSFITASYIAEKHMLPGYDPLDKALMIHHKDKFRSLLLKLDLPVPSFKKLLLTSNLDLNDLKYPLLLKPVDLTGGKGIQLVRNENELRVAISETQARSKQDTLLVEEFIEGSNHGFSSIIKDKKVNFSFFDNEHYYKNPFLVSGASFPSQTISKNTKEKVAEQIGRIAEELQLVDGLVHTQFIQPINGNSPILVEICRRTPGDLYPMLVEIATGLNYSEKIIEFACGVKDFEINTSIKNKFFLRHCVMSSRNGTLKKFIVSEELEKRVVHRFDLKTPGQFISDYMTEKVSILLLKFDSQNEMNTFSSDFENEITLEVK